jgi:hypothetical protein
MNNCTLSILTAVTDVPFMMHTVPHLVKMCNYPFRIRQLVMDVAPPSSDFKHRPGISSLEALYTCGEALKSAGVVDRILSVDYSEDFHRAAYKKHLGRYLPNTHNHRGAPVLPYIYAIEAAETDYFLHFDSDMLLYNQKGWSWVEEAIDHLKANPDLVCIMPRFGPPAHNRSTYQICAAPTSPDMNLDYLIPDETDSLFKMRVFTSRIYLFDLRRLEKLLPLKPELKANGGLISWEQMVGSAMNFYCRADMKNPRAWTLHPVKHNAKWLAVLPSIIQEVEQGRYPDEQAGEYNIRLGSWLRRLNLDQSAPISTIEDVFSIYLPKKLSEIISGPNLPRLTYMFNLSDQVRKHWHFSISESRFSISQRVSQPDCIIYISGKDLIDIANGDLHASWCVWRGRLKAHGSQIAFNFLIDQIFEGKIYNDKSQSVNQDIVRRIFSSVRYFFFISGVKIKRYIKKGSMHFRVGRK